MEPFYRGRRLRKNAAIRSMIRETRLSPEDFVLPIFVVEGENIKEEIPSLPGIYHYSVDRLDEIAGQMEQAGVPACILFGIPDHKDSCGTAASDPEGVVQQAMRRLRQLSPDTPTTATAASSTPGGRCSTTPLCPIWRPSL